MAISISGGGGGASSSPRVAHVPTLTGFGTGGTPPTNVSITATLLNGDTLHLHGSFTTGTPTAVEARLSLPAGMTVDVTDSTSVGYGVRNTLSAALVNVLGDTGNAFLQFALVAHASVPADIPQNGDTMFGASETVHLNCMIPVNVA